MGYVERKKEKLEEIYRAYKDDVYRICMHFTKNPAIARELTQQTFFNFYEHLDQVEIESIRGYLVRAARNICFNYIRDSKREQARGSMDTLVEGSATVISVEEAYIMGEQRKQEKGLGRNILDRLREENELWYTAINLIYCLGKPHDVVADEMGISKDALYSLLYRARKWIYKNYNQKYEDIIKRS